jgi:serine/threonine-protein kinase
MLQVGSTLNKRYEILSKIGTGGMSYVYKAKDSKLGRNVAVKVLKEEFCLDESFVRKFKVEAQSAASLSHHNIVNIYDVGNEGRIHFIVMEYLEGETLKDYIRNHGSMSENMQLKIALSIASALDHAHNNHIIHRDIKPQNIMLTNDGKIKVTDFGIARVATDKTIEMPENTSGSVYYMAPEQARGGYQDNKSDLYSLGITMFEMATGHLPYDGDNAVNIALKQIHDPMPNPRDLNDNISNNIETIIMKATMKKVSQRYQSASEMVVDIKSAIKNPEAILHYEMENPNEETMIMGDSEMKHIWSKAEVKEYSSERDPLDRFMIIGGVATALAAVAIIVILLIGRFTDQYVPVSVTVPDLSGKTITEAGAVLENLGLTINVEQREYNNEVEKDRIISQIPGGSSVVLEETIVQVVVSDGIKYSQVLSVVREGYDSAYESLIQAGFDVEVNYQFNEFIAVGKIITQEPAANTEVPEGSTVTITVSKGPEEVYVTVPNVIGETEQNAATLLELEGMKLGNITYLYDEDVEKDKIISMSTDPGTSVKEGYIVDVTISLGEPIIYRTVTITVPNVLNADQTECELSIVYEYTDVETGELTSREVVREVVEAVDFPYSFQLTGYGEGTLYIYNDGVKEFPQKVNLE